MFIGTKHNNIAFNCFIFCLYFLLVSKAKLFSQLIIKIVSCFAVFLAVDLSLQLTNFTLTEDYQNTSSSQFLQTEREVCTWDRGVSIIIHYLHAVTSLDR